LNECEIGDQGATAVFEGLIKNTKLTTISLNKNRIHANGVQKLIEGPLGREGQLKHLDLSKNDIGDEGMNSILLSIKSSSPCHLQTLKLQECNLSDSSCRALTLLAKEETSLLRIELEGNIVNHKLTQEISNLCTGNRERKKKSMMPAY